LRVKKTNSTKPGDDDAKSFMEKSFSILSTFEHQDVVRENNNDNIITIIIIDESSGSSSKKNTFVLFFEQQKRWRML
jgi:hypothetical protein